MITQNELSTVRLSATKQDYYQNWNEILELAHKISERWDPESTNESDPGIVLLKVLTAVAEKINYNIDAKVLGEYMPSTAEMESMRALCEMMGYNIKYYQSATTNVTFAFTGKLESDTDCIEIPAFTTITNVDKDVNYLTTKPFVFDKTNKVFEIPVIEGQLVQCESDDDNIITANQLDDDFKYYLPETQIAENGIFVYNVNNGVTSERWEKALNLNTVSNGCKVFKFGYDSKESRPYIQFPEDVTQLIEDGLIIYYIRTSGLNGNISARTLSTFELPAGEEKYKVDDFTVTNLNAATNGANIETITQAYNGFKKTVGTFDTLVTCRDYMNKIYNLTTKDNISLVSNVIVSDIRDDINRAVTLCSFNDYGICYTEQPLYEKNNGNSVAKINNFDLVLYPFKIYHNLGTRSDYVDSFKYNAENRNLIEFGLKENKTLAHNFVYPKNNSDEIVCIKNYLKLNARITTTYKVNSTEESIILANIKSAIYDNFNMRKLDFGEEIPFDSILEVIENADTRIKNVSLDEPILSTIFAKANGEELAVASVSDKNNANSIYNKLALRNILAGRVNLFNYNTDFKCDLSEKQLVGDYGLNSNYPVPTKEGAKTKIVGMESKCELTSNIFNKNNRIVLSENEVIKFRAPNFKTIVTYPAYVNYYLKLNSGGGSGSEAAQAAKFITLLDFIKKHEINTDESLQKLLLRTDNPTEDDLKAWFNSPKYILYKQDGTNYELIENEDKIDTKSAYSVLYIDEKSFGSWAEWVRNQELAGEQYKGIFKSNGYNLYKVPGYLVDENKCSYTLCTSWPSIPSFADLYVQDDTNANENNKYNLGKNGQSLSIPANSEYQLQTGEYLLINYTESSSTDEGSTTTGAVKNIVYKSTPDKPIIIRPNFKIEDSNSKHNDTSWSKTSGYIFTTLQPEGMFSLGVNEQIEIREPAAVQLGDSDNLKTIYLYWTFGEALAAGTRYTLKDGEYVYYTDEAKLSMAYYGSGTEIILPDTDTVSLPLLADSSDTNISADEIISKGIAAIDWQPITLPAGKFITFNEYQYIVLAAGDTLETWPFDSQTDNITNEWKVCSGTKSINYICNGTAGSLAAINVTGASWKARSVLEFNMGPDKTQTLHYPDQITLKIEKYYSDAAKDLKWQVTDDINFITKQDMPISLRSNYVCKATADKVDTRITKYTAGGISDENKLSIDDFKVKLFTEDTIYLHTIDNAGTDTAIRAVPLHNLNNTWTKVALKTLDGNGYINLNANIGTNAYGLIMFYYLATDEATVNAYLQTDGVELKIFNNYSKEPTYTLEGMTWWSKPEDNKYYLKQGINIVLIEQGTTLSLRTKTTSLDTIVFSDLDIIDKKLFTRAGDTVSRNSLGLNIELLDYQDIEEIGDAPKQLLKDLYEADPEHKFYYNFPLDNETALEINTDLFGTDEQETLSSPRVWYDYNNVNNKFVISQIDTNYLASGIKIAKSSKI